MRRHAQSSKSLASKSVPVSWLPGSVAGKRRGACTAQVGSCRANRGSSRASAAYTGRPLTGLTLFESPKCSTQPTHQTPSTQQTTGWLPDYSSKRLHRPASSAPHPVQEFTHSTQQPTGWLLVSSRKRSYRSSSLEGVTK